MKRSSMRSATLPVESQSAESLYSFSTATSTSTFVGPGSLAGKAIQNFGKLTLKGIDQILISRRLSSIATHFPHRNYDNVAGLREMYSDLLELSRIHMYPDSTRIRALQLIMRQIASRSTAYLIEALRVWPEVEVNLLLSEILALLKMLSFLPIDKIFPNGRIILWTPIVDFLRFFASSGEETWSTAINCGSLDLLLHLYVSDFQESLSYLVDLLEFSGSSTLDEDTCFRALRSLYRLWACVHSDEVGAGLEMYIEQTPPDHARETFIRIVHRLILLLSRAPESDPFFMLCPKNCLSSESCPLNLDAVVHFIHRLMRVSRYNETLRHWLIDGDIVRLLDSTATRLLSGGTLKWNDDTADPRILRTQLEVLVIGLSCFR
ncbi:hypothetical protein BT96DRAFT_990347 [Gymnopus androsaceus JB14]|uniref:Uncharacterized protein n=1 Tax=Gymnopus androsaceus JB14 TaxID=1447944 RepID=A0A6A4HYL1_9AGAR|nr:hypothetical protein BT96DRAFT_990347 [Gymnopus androsaceus JB14]